MLSMLVGMCNWVPVRDVSIIRMVVHASMYFSSIMHGTLRSWRAHARPTGGAMAFAEMNTVSNLHTTTETRPTHHICNSKCILYLLDVTHWGEYAANASPLNECWE